MDLSKTDMHITKGVAILFMLILHLFCRKDINGLYETYIFIDDVPLIYYLALFGDACVPMYCFASGYGLYISYKMTNKLYMKKNIKRVFKLIVNYWIILVVFTIIGSFAGDVGKYPGSITEFLLNFFVLSNSYNGAWWFLQTYILLVLISPIIFKIINKYNVIIILLGAGIIYLVSYIERIDHIIDLGENKLIINLINAIALLGTSLLPFIIGSIFAREKVYTKFRGFINKLSYKNIACVMGIILLVVIHSVYESMVIAPITGTAFICFFNVMDKSIVTQKILRFFGNHSTNIWLTHMFFYMTIFPEITFVPKYPIFIIIWLIVLCLLSSYIINIIYKLITRTMDKGQIIKRKDVGSFAR